MVIVSPRRIRKYKHTQSELVLFFHRNKTDTAQALPELPRLSSPHKAIKRCLCTPEERLHHDRSEPGRLHESKEPDPKSPPNEIPPDRLSRMAEVSLGIASNLDMHAVLQGVIDGARSLTGARYGALVSFDDSGDIRDLVISGMTPEQLQGMGSPPKGLGLLGYLNEVPKPLRLRDIASHPKSVGFPENHPPMKTFMGTPVRHLGEPVGNIYLTENLFTISSGLALRRREPPFAGWY